MTIFNIISLADDHSCERGNCSHACVNTPQGHICLCPEGYEKISHSTCKDINECSLLHNDCSQRCKNYPGNYSCYCVEGFELRTDRKHCKVKGTFIFKRYVHTTFKVLSRNSYTKNGGTFISNSC